MSEKTIQTRADLETVLRRITFAPSCLALAWEWEAKTAYDDPLSGPIARLGWLVRTSFLRPDTATGEVNRGFGRWEFVAVGTSESGVVKTCWLLCKLIVEHELHEAFLVDGIRLFDPHRTVDELQLAAKAIAA
jgi:hypothetical protein